MLLSMQGICKSFNGIPALRAASLEVGEAEERGDAGGIEGAVADEVGLRVVARLGTGDPRVGHVHTYEAACSLARVAGGIAVAAAYGRDQGQKKDRDHPAHGFRPLYGPRL